MKKMMIIMALLIFCLMCSSALAFLPSGTGNFLHDSPEEVERKHIDRDMRGITGLFDSPRIKPIITFSEEMPDNSDGDIYWNGLNVTVTYDANEYVTSSGRSLKFEMVGNHAFAPLVQYLLDTDDANDPLIIGTTSTEPGVEVTGAVGLWIYCNEPNNIDSFELRLIPRASDTGDYWSYNIVGGAGVGFRKGLPDDQWWWVSIDSGEWNATIGLQEEEDYNGSYTIEGETYYSPVGERIQAIKFHADSSDDVNVWIDGIWTEDYPKAAICLGFDGPYDDAEDDWGRLTSKNYPGVIYASAQAIYDEQADKLTVSQIQSYQDLGWDVFGHNWQLQYNGDYTADEVEQDMIKGKKWLAANGFYGGLYLCSPLGSSGQVSGDLANSRDYVKEHFLFSRSQWMDYSMYKRDVLHTTGTPSPRMGLLGWIKPDRYNFVCLAWHDIDAVIPEVTGDYTEANLIKAAKIFLKHLTHQKGFALTYTHKIIEEALEDNHTSNDEWTAIMDTIDAYVASGDLEVITLSEYLNRTYLRPGQIKLRGEPSPMFYINDPNGDETRVAY